VKVVALDVEASELDSVLEGVVERVISDNRIAFFEVVAIVDGVDEAGSDGGGTEA